jgi:hypothetical protein
MEAPVSRIVGKAILAAKKTYDNGIRPLRCASGFGYAPAPLAAILQSSKPLGLIAPELPPLAPYRTFVAVVRLRDRQLSVRQLRLHGFSHVVHKDQDNQLPAFEPALCSSWRHQRRTAQRVFGRRFHRCRSAAHGPHVSSFERCLFRDTNLKKVDFQTSNFSDCRFEGELREVSGGRAARSRVRRAVVTHQQTNRVRVAGMGRQEQGSACCGVERRCTTDHGRTSRPAPGGFRRVRVHDLKHTCGRRLRAAG